MKLLRCELIILIVLFFCTACDNGGSYQAGSPNSIAGSTVLLNNSSYGGGSAAIVGLVNRSNLISLLNANGEFWQAPYAKGSNPNWAALSAPGESLATAIALNISGIVFGGTALGNSYLYSQGQWLQQTTTESSTIKSMVVTNGNVVYIGNDLGHVWLNENLISGNSGITTAITQISVDSIASPYFLGVASGAYIYAYQINGGQWKNLITAAENAGISYSDSGSQINAIAFTSPDGRIDYGYFGNAAGHVWRVVYDTATGTLQAFQNMSSLFSGFAGNGAITALAVDSSNNVYAATSSGQLFIWTTSTTAWSNITPSSNTAAITAISIYNSNTVFVGTNSGQIWSITWGGN